MSVAAQTVNINAYCHCKTHTYTFPIPLSNLPLEGSYCHCNQCRHGGGVLFTSYAQLPQSVPPPYSPESPIPSTLAVYQTIPQAKRYFCKKCGTHLFYRSTPDGISESEHWSVATGALSKTGDGIVEYKYHEHVQVGPQKDGIDFIALLDDKLPRYPTDESDGKPPLSDAEITELLEVARPSGRNSASAGDASAHNPTKPMEISCRCGSVRALLSRPLAHPENQWLKKFANTSTNKWLGAHCLCESCRLSSGYPVMSWVFVSQEHVQWLPSPNPAPRSPGGKGGEDYRAAAGMSHWRSRVDVERSFCATCGATVLFEIDERPGMYDVAAGLLATSSGADDGLMLRNWVYWDPQVDFCEDAEGYDKQLAAHLKAGHAEYMRTQ